MDKKKKTFPGMHTLYQSYSCSFHTNPADYRSVRACKKIHAGSVILIEHIFSAEYYPEAYERSRAYLLHNPSYAAELWPRDPENDQLSEELCARKLQSNLCMDSFHGKLFLGNRGTWFNHSYDYNAVVQFTEPVQVCIQNTIYFEYFVYYSAWRNIDIGEEVTVMYNENVPFAECPRPETVNVPDLHAFHRRFSYMLPFVYREVNKYLKTPEFAQTALVQIAAFHGILFDEVKSEWIATDFFARNLQTCYPGWTVEQWLDLYKRMLLQMIM